MTKYRVLAVVAVLAALTTSGCQGPVGADVAETTTPVESSATSAAPSDVPTPTPTPTDTASAPTTPTETATATPTPTATATASAGKPELADLKLSSEGLGYVRIGEAVPEVPKDERIVEWKDNFCGFTGDYVPGAWETLYPTKSNGNLQFYVQAYPDKTTPVDAIFILSDKIRTEHGLGIGSTLAAVKALGGVKERQKKDVDFYLDAWVIHGSAGELVFWITNDTGEKSQREIVQNVEVIPEGDRPAFVFTITPCE